MIGSVESPHRDGCSGTSSQEAEMLEGAGLREAVEFAITTERLGARFYEMLAEKFRDDEEVHGLFVQLTLDEEEHEREFSSLRERVPAEEMDIPEISQGVLKAWSISEFFSSSDGLMRDLDAIQTRADAVERALELEKQTLGYYETLRDVMGDDPTLDVIIEAEKSHIVSLGGLL
jgi:rubrerythrin